MPSKTKTKANTKSKPNTIRTINRTNQSQVEVQYVEENLDKQPSKRRTQKQLVELSLSPHLKTSSTINISIDTDESNQDESTDDEQEERNLNTLKSEVWQYATRLNNGKAKCNKCDREISCKDHSTTGIRRHLYHCMKIPSFTRHINASSTSSIGRDMTQRLNELVYKCIIEDGRTFGDFRKPGISHLLEQIVPGNYYYRINS
ncbi:unnamed protein product [Rotaria magnacalcarata]|uniref:BED-type domain-containing protein n=1 Tax=Rotaria magnacalcarata TaxID=392030 RepID=A0A816MUW8_9BILA|nr:unnamed protein product [Rotaria magnacalcarata]CAF3911745.1 unnamed protein product [Rotaria magnacalcarata]